MVMETGQICKKITMIQESMYQEILDNTEVPRIRGQRLKVTGESDRKKKIFKLE